MSTQSNYRTPQELMNLWRRSDTPFFINFQNSIKNPREEGFCDMLTFTCLPTFKFQSMSFALIVVNTFYYVVSLIYDISLGNSLLEPSQTSLFSLGMIYPYFIKYQLQYQRIFVSLLLYTNFVNYCSSQMAILVYGSYVEKLLGWKKLWLIGLAGGVGGVLLSITQTDQPHVNGNSVPLTYIGLLFGYFCLKFESWDYTGSGRWQMLAWILLGLAITYYESMLYVLMDNFANLGSFFIGLLLSMVFIETLTKDDHDDHRCIISIATLVLVSYYIILFVYFVFYRHPQLISV